MCREKIDYFDRMAPAGLYGRERKQEKMILEDNSSSYESCNPCHFSVYDTCVKGKEKEVFPSGAFPYSTLDRTVLRFV